MAGAALLRPLGPHASPRLRLAVSLGLGLGVAGTALLASLRGHGKAEPLAFYAFLTLCTDALGQLLAPLGWPVWPLMVLLVGAVSGAETLPVAVCLAALSLRPAATRASPTLFSVVPHCPVTT